MTDIIDLILDGTVFMKRKYECPQCKSDELEIIEEPFLNIDADVIDELYIEVRCENGHRNLLIYKLNSFEKKEDK